MQSTESEAPLSVGEVTRRVKRLLNDESLVNVRVEGEVSNFHHHDGSGHMYFSLVEDDVTLKCVMFRWQNQHLEFTPEDGDDVVTEGDVTVYENRSQYQLQVDSMERVGDGELYQRYLELRRRLKEEGLFEDRHKKELPGYPDRVGVVTSESGAALHDVRDVLRRRFPVDVLLAPATVQGDGAADEIAYALREIDGCVDVVIVGRGGGSMEDLWAFNEEAVARAIYEMETPVVSAVGHEVDVTIADFVADERAATPSEAAELVVPSKDSLIRRLDSLETSLDRAVVEAVERRHRRLENVERYLERAPAVKEYASRLVELERRLEDGVEDAVAGRADGVKAEAEVLESMNPLKVLSRGYAVVESDGEAVRSVEAVSAGDTVTATVADGEFDGTVDDVRRKGGEV